MKMRVTLSQRPSILTAISGEVVLPQLSEPKYIVTYNMTEGCSTTDKFINLYKENITEPFYCSYNLYKNSTDKERFFKLKIELNSIIQKINTEIDELPDIDKSLMLDTTSLDIESAKTNELHLYFEDKSNKIIEGGRKYKSGIYELLEDINQLVHSIEQYPPKVKDKEFFCTLRIYPDDIIPVPTVPMTNEDYENICKNPTWGNLVLDYFRVGKDLNHCYHTNDLELIKTKGLSQQNTVHTCFELVFDDWRPDKELDDYEKSYRKWIEDNNFKQYYDTDLPMFNIGRVVLGKIDMAGTTEEEIQNELDKCTSVINVELIDE